jgi:hypothetical protein
MEYIYERIDEASSKLLKQIKNLDQKLPEMQTLLLTAGPSQKLTLDSIGSHGFEEFSSTVVRYYTELLTTSFISKGTLLNFSSQVNNSTFVQNGATYEGSNCFNSLSGLFRKINQTEEYIGYLVNDFKHGVGFSRVTQGYTYIGEWFCNSKQGYGICDWKISQNGARDWYRGNFKSDLMHGYGEYFYSDGTKYFGEWNEGKKQGKGTMYYIDGHVYTGSFHSDRRNGHGETTYENGEKYIGSFENDKRHGIGTLFRNNGRIYHGNFNYGAMTGMFRVTLRRNGNNEEWSGPIVNEQLNGRGTIRIGMVFGPGREVMFANDEIVG